MSVAIDIIKDQTGSNVLLTIRQADGTSEVVEGKIEVASAAGVGFKPKGKRELDLIEPEDVLGLEVAPVAEAKLKQSKLKPIDLAKVKKHLVDRHGAPLSQVNALSPEQALELHTKIDHSDLGHNHDGVDKPEETPPAEAV